MMLSKTYHNVIIPCALIKGEVLHFVIFAKKPFEAGARRPDFIRDLQTKSA